MGVRMFDVLEDVLDVAEKVCFGVLVVCLAIYAKPWTIVRCVGESCVLKLGPILVLGVVCLYLL